MHVRIMSVTHAQCRLITSVEKWRSFGTFQTLDWPGKSEKSVFFAARCYAERGYTTVCCPSVCPSVRRWRSGTVIT